MMYVVCLVGFSPGVLEFWLTSGGCNNSDDDSGSTACTVASTKIEK